MLVDDDVSEHVLEKLKARFPGENFTPVLHPEGHDFRWTFGPSASPTPQFGPASLGSGVSSLPLGWLSRCLKCASCVVLYVFDERIDDAETAREFRCVKCGWYSAYRARWCATR